MNIIVEIQTKSNDNVHYIKYQEEKKKTSNIANIKEKSIRFKTKIDEHGPSFRMNIIAPDNSVKAYLNSFNDFDKLFELVDQVRKRQKIKDKPTDTNFSLYSNDSARKTNYGYSNAEKARATIKELTGQPQTYQYKVINTMYNRAKYHPSQTSDMRAAMKIYKKWMEDRKGTEKKYKGGAKKETQPESPNSKKPAVKK